MAMSSWSDSHLYEAMLCSFIISSNQAKFSFSSARPIVSASVRVYQWYPSSIRSMFGPTASRTAAQALISIDTLGANDTGGIQVCSLIAL